MKGQRVQRKGRGNENNIASNTGRVGSCACECVCLLGRLTL